MFCTLLYSHHYYSVAHVFTRQQRKLKRALQRSLRATTLQRNRSKLQLESLSILEHPSLDTLNELPRKFEEMFNACSSFEPLDAATLSALVQVELTEPGKRPWESTKSGYLKWATERLLEKVKEQDGGSSAVTDLVDRMDRVGQAQRLRDAAKVLEIMRESLGTMGQD